MSITKSRGLIILAVVAVAFVAGRLSSDRRDADRSGKDRSRPTVVRTSSSLITPRQSLARPFGLCFIEEKPTVETEDYKIVDLHIGPTNTILFYKTEGDMAEYVKIYFEAINPQQYRLHVLEHKYEDDVTRKRLHGLYHEEQDYNPKLYPAFRFKDGKAVEGSWYHDVIWTSPSSTTPVIITSSREIADDGEIVFYIYFKTPLTFSAENYLDLDLRLGQIDWDFINAPESFTPDHIRGQLVRLHYRILP